MLDGQANEANGLGCSPPVPCNLRMPIGFSKRSACTGSAGSVSFVEWLEGEALGPLSGRPLCPVRCGWCGQRAFTTGGYIHALTKIVMQQLRLCFDVFIWFCTSQKKGVLAATYSPRTAIGNANKASAWHTTDKHAGARSIRLKVASPP